MQRYLNYQLWISKLSSPDNRNRYRARTILLGFPQGIVNPKSLAAQRRYQKEYRRVHKLRNKLATQRYQAKIKAKFGYVNERSRWLAADDNKEIKSKKRKEFYGKGRGSNIKKLFQLSYEVGASRQRASWDLCRGRNPKTRGTLDMPGVSQSTRCIGNSKKTNGKKARNTISAPRKIRSRRTTHKRKGD